MAHLVVVREGWIELRYTGVVDYAARMSALDAVATAVLESGVHRILADYTRATLGDAGDRASRQDYLSKAISAAALEQADVALIGLPPEHARAAERAGVVRKMRVRHFEDAESALAWCCRRVTCPHSLNFPYGSEAVTGSRPGPRAGRASDFGQSGHRRCDHRAAVRYQKWTFASADVRHYAQRRPLRRRAEMVGRYLQEAHGIASDRIALFWYGPNNPLVPNDSAENQAKNRRVEIRVGLRGAT